MDPEAMLTFEHLPVHVSFGSQSLKRAEGAEAGLGEEVEQQVGTGVHLSLPALSWFLATQGTEQSLSGLPHLNSISKLAPKVPSLLSDKLHHAPVSPSAPPHAQHTHRASFQRTPTFPWLLLHWYGGSLRYLFSLTNLPSLATTPLTTHDFTLAGPSPKELQTKGPGGNTPISLAYDGDSISAAAPASRTRSLPPLLVLDWELIAQLPSACSLEV